MNSERHYLPFSSRRYQVSNVGDVVDCRNGNIIPSTSINGHLNVLISWLDGERFYPIGILVLVTFNKLRLPDHLFEKIELLYTDNNSRNLSPGNLIYRFKNGPLETEDYPGFYHVPLYCGYAISRNGVLINVETGKEKTWSITKPDFNKNQRGGYFYNRAIDDRGRSVTLFRHRAIALVFHKYDETVLKKHVNHKDGFPGNDWVDNLEWCTPKENIEHAFTNGLRKDNKPILAYHVLKGEEFPFASINRCAEFIGSQINDGFNKLGMVYDRLRRGSLEIYQDWWVFKYKGDDRPWPTMNQKNLKIVRANKRNALIARNIFTKEVSIFRGLGQCSEYTSVKGGTINHHVRTDSVLPLNGWIIRYYDRGLKIDWPEFDEYQLKIFAKYPIYPPNGLKIFDAEKQKERFFTSVAEATQALKIDKKLIWDCIRGKKKLLGKYDLEVVRVNARVSLRE